MKKCNYRHCGKRIPEDAHKNSNYCPNEDGESECYRKEKLLRQKENEIAHRELEKRKSTLLTTLKNVTLHQQARKITIERFSDLFADYIDLFEKRMLEGSTVLFFDNFEIFKVNIDDIIYLKIIQDEKN